MGAVRFCVVCHLIAHARTQSEGATVLELGVELAADAKKNVALDAPVICTSFDLI